MKASNTQSYVQIQTIKGEDIMEDGAKWFPPELRTKYDFYRDSYNKNQYFILSIEIFLFEGCIFDTNLTVA